MGRVGRTAERLCCLEIDTEVETRRLLEWQVCRLGSLQNAINQIGRAIVNFIQVGAIGRQTAFAYIVGPLVGGRQPMFSSKFVDPPAIEASECTCVVKKYCGIERPVSKLLQR